VYKHGSPNSPISNKVFAVAVHMTVFKEKGCIYENRFMPVPQRHAMEPAGGVEVRE
jgi:hypothetical protein